jgi:hypothetical protein
MGDERHPFFTKVPRLFGFDAANPDLRGDFWARVAFYNYIQQVVGEDPRVEPTESMWAEGELPFNDVLEHLQPERVVVFGLRLWNRIPRGIPRVLRNLDATTVEARALRLFNGSEILFGRTDHPSSSRFKYATWKPQVELLLRA